MLANFNFMKGKRYIETKSNEYLFIVFHSSNFLFKEFNLSKITNLGGDLYGKGFYFTDNIVYSKRFGKYTYKCEILLNNPINLINKSTKYQLTNLLNNINITQIDFNIILELINSNSYTTAFRYIRKHISFNELNDKFDGVIGYIDDDSYGKEYVVYNPKNIKILEIIKN